MRSVNPYTGLHIADYPAWSAEQLQERLQLAEQQAPAWQQMPVGERAALLRVLAAALTQQAGTYAALITTEMGKVYAEAEAEVEKCARLCISYAQDGPYMLAEEELGSAVVQHSPLGGVLAIMPWNFPFWQVFRCAIPALLAGNVVLLKHAPNVCGCALALEDLFIQCGFPKYVFNTLLIDEAAVETAISHRLVQGVAFTGSVRAGAVVAGIAGTYIKKTVLELGGSDPCVVLAGAQVGRAADIAVQSRYQNAGQSCIAAKRWIVEKAVYADFQKQVVEAVTQMQAGDPMQAGIHLGPLARPDLADAFFDIYHRTIQAGAKVLVPCERIGNVVTPGILSEVTPDMPAGKEELFGPCGVLMRAAGETEAIQLANATTFGLGASVFAKDDDHAEAVARQLQAGTVYLNRLMQSDPMYPFGGILQSGYGKELGKAGVMEWVNQKVIVPTRYKFTPKVLYIDEPPREGV